MSELSERVGRHIRRRRIELGLNQRQLADRIVDQNPEKNAAVSNQTVSNWERGINEPGAHYKSALATALDVDVSYFVAEDPKGPTPDPFPPADDDRLARIEQQLADARAEREQHAERIENLLQRQDTILARIEAAVSEERAAKAENDESAQRLLAAVEVARRALRAETPSRAAAPAPPAK